MQYLHKHSLYISNPKISCDFYINKLGMKLLNSFEKDSNEYYHLSFDANFNSKEAILELIYEKHNKQTIFPIKENTLNGYWKIAISIKDVDIARNNLINMGVEVGKAFEVPNVAYLCHFHDPDGYCLELIAHKFLKNHIKQEEDKSYKLGNKPVFSLVTYRVKDIDESLDFYVNKLGLKLYSKMDVSFRGFNLYFLAANFEKLPDEKNIQSLENVQWLWQRNFTLIELQELVSVKEDKGFKYKVGRQTGFAKLTFASNTNETLKDPDGYIICKEKIL